MTHLDSIVTAKIHVDHSILNEKKYIYNGLRSGFVSHYITITHPCNKLRFFAAEIMIISVKKMSFFFSKHRLRIHVRSASLRLDLYTSGSLWSDCYLVEIRNNRMFSLASIADSFSVNDINNRSFAIGTDTVYVYMTHPLDFFGMFSLL